MCSRKTVLRDDGFNNPDSVLIFFVILSAPAFQLEMKITRKLKTSEILTVSSLGTNFHDVFLSCFPSQFLEFVSLKNITISWLNCLHRSWWRMLGLECIGDKNKMLATVFAISVTNINYLFTGYKCWWHTISYIFTNIKIASLHQHQNSFTNIHESSTTSRCHQHPQLHSYVSSPKVWPLFDSPFLTSFSSWSSLLLIWCVAIAVSSTKNSLFNAWWTETVSCFSIVQSKWILSHVLIKKKLESNFDSKKSKKNFG